MSWTGERFFVYCLCRKTSDFNRKTAGGSGLSATLPEPPNSSLLAPKNRHKFLSLECHGQVKDFSCIVFAERQVTLTAKLPGGPDCPPRCRNPPTPRF